MVSLSVTRLVVSGGSRATGRRCDVVSVTDLRSIANISLLMLDIDVMDPAYQSADQRVRSADRLSSAPRQPKQITDWIVPSRCRAPACEGDSGSLPTPSQGGRRTSDALRRDFCRLP